jgi:ribosomal-protein-alanine N-acetyltransferase
LRPLAITDAETIYNNWASDPDVTQFTSWNLHPSVSATIGWLTVEQKNISLETNYTWGFVLKETCELFGSGGINYNEKYQMYELGYCIMKKHWNSGLTTEASKTIIDFAAQKLGIVSLLGRHAAENIASGKIMEKLGFRYQKNGHISSVDGKRTFNSREYLLQINPES